MADKLALDLVDVVIGLAMFGALWLVLLLVIAVTARQVLFALERLVSRVVKEEEDGRPNG